MRKTYKFRKDDVVSDGMCSLWMVAGNRYRYPTMMGWRVFEITDVESFERAFSLKGNLNDPEYVISVLSRKGSVRGER